MKTPLSIFLLAIIAATAVVAEPTVAAAPAAHANVPQAHPAISVQPSIELGFVDVPHNVIQYGKGTDSFDFVTKGGQEVLFPYSRFRIDIGLGERQRHFVGLLYQPLTFETVTQFEKTLTIDTETFDEGQVVDLVYGFDFWRGTYEYRIVDGEHWRVDAGASLQLRNASIRFKAQEGDELVVSQGTGPVPALRAQARYTTDSRFWVEAEADGFYASNAFINGAEYPFTGWIWDAALSAGAPITRYAETYLSLRTIGGGAEGTATDTRETWTESRAGGDERYTRNELTTVAVSVGVRLLF
ncbi:MAG: hypothetical protein GVY14_14635 [Spirochaetes bacterium]|jgi:hypothetical protein|nr:hypothetical protein [Spirochaetota bacterium]